MSTMNYWSASILILLVETAESARVLPRPILDIGEVTPYSITLTWTMPPNELYEEFVVEMVPEEGNIDDFSPQDMKRKFTNLTPGTLYTFTVRTVRDRAFSDPSIIRQDTRPLVPNNLSLRTFDTLVVTMNSPIFGDFEYTLETHGVDASWDSPTDGASECYHAEISYADSREVFPAEDQEISRGDSLRQFTNLEPGRTYTVTVYSATCGEGHLGELRSDGISEDIFVPPSPPPNVLIEEESTSVELTWGEPEGQYDDFEIIETTVTDGGMTVNEVTDNRELGRTVTGLKPCTEYGFEIFSLLEGVRSESATSVNVITRPVNDVIVSVASFDETSVTFDLRSPSNALVEYELTLLPSGRTVKTNGSSVTFRNLTPGLKYSVTTTTICREHTTTKSIETTTTEITTRPLTPTVTASCEFIGVKEAHRQLYAAVPWDAPSYSRITLTWQFPTSGTWENFVVDYSPHVFEEGVPSPTGPILLSGDTTSTTVEVPVTGRVITTSLRTLSNNVASEPIIEPAICGDDAILRCRSFVHYWNIIITPIENNQLRVEIPSFAIHNATVYIGGKVSVFFVNIFIIQNPCDTNPSARIVVYPQCPDILPHCPTIIRPICPTRLRGGGGGRGRVKNACCHNKLYSTENQICCHNTLLKKSERDNEECCLQNWYDSTARKCCRSGETVLRDGTC